MQRNGSADIQHDGGELIVMRARLAAAASVLAVAVGIVLGGGAGAAQAADPKVLVSTDGVHFSNELTVALFSDIGTLVPQDVDMRSIWVRNPIAVPVYMRISLAGITTTSTEFAQSVALTGADASAATSTTALLADLARCDVIIGSTIIPAGGTARFDLSVSMLDVTDQVSQSQNGSLSFLVGMRDGEAGAFPANACDDVNVVVPAADPPGGLVITGADMPYDWFVLATALMGFGLLLVWRRQRERAEES